MSDLCERDVFFLFDFFDRDALVLASALSISLDRVGDSSLATESVGPEVEVSSEEVGGGLL